MPAPRDSLAWRVIDFLGANPGESLTRSDVATKFDIDHAVVDTLLAPAVDAGQLVRDVGGADGVVWRLVQPKAKFPQPFTSSLMAAKRAARARRNALIDISSFVIEKDIPLVEPLRRENQWNNLFSQMIPGDSVKVPNEARMALAHAQAKYRKTATNVTFAIRKISDTHTRIWRTA